MLGSDPDRRDQVAQRVYEALSRGYADRTNANDEGVWKKWEQFTRAMETAPWRSDMAANTGADPEGYMEEVFLLVAFLIHVYDRMRPRRHSDPAADPRSAKKNVEAIRRRHVVRGITMVSMAAVVLACKGMCRTYIEAYGVDTLVPDRKLPFTQPILTGMFDTPNGAKRGNLTVDWSEYRWIATRACVATLAEEGSRKDEVAKATANTPFRKGRFTFASLAWYIDGKALKRPPTRAELRTLRDGDGVLLKHGIAKNDPMGAYFAATPSFLAYRSGDPRCACRALAAMELAAAVPLEQRATTPLFGPSPGEEFTHAQLDAALLLLLSTGGQVPEDELKNYSVHSFRIFAACALLAADAPRWLIKRMLRWRGDESLELYARVNNEKWAEYTAKMVTVSVDSNVATRLDYMDFSPETRTRFNDIAKSMLSLSASSARAVSGPP